MGGCAGGGPPQDVSCHDKMRISTADPFRTLGCNPARSHMAVLAAGAFQAEVAMWFLCVKTVKRSFDAGLFHMNEQFAYGRIRRSGNDICFARELIIRAHCGSMKLCLGRGQLSTETIDKI
jgi:hypothetical protein